MHGCFRASRLAPINFFMTVPYLIKEAVCVVCTYAVASSVVLLLVRTWCTAHVRRRLINLLIELVMMIVCLLYTYKLNILHTEHIINTLSLVRKLHAWGFVSCGRWAWDVQSSPVRLRNSGCGAQPEHRCQPSRAAGMYAICSMLVP